MINADTQLYGVFGHPVRHSLSPLMHATAFAHLGINAVYLAFDVTDIQPAVAAVRTLGIRGVSITIPHKISVIPFLDDIDPLAGAIGAVNTIVVKENRLLGVNTDGAGAMAALREKCLVKDRRIAVIGAGGAARAIAFTGKAEGAEIVIVNRTVGKGKGLADDLDAAFVPLSEFRGACDILINTTPVGMAHHGADQMPVSEKWLQAGMVVMDIVYNPLRTKLLKTAAARGCETIDGAAMFVRQGVRQFELWTGRTAPVRRMHQTVLSELEAGQNATRNTND